MASADFLINEVKERIIKGLNTEYPGFMEGKLELEAENKLALAFYLDQSKLLLATEALITNAKLECQNSGMIPGNKEVLGIVTLEKARNGAVDYWKANK